MNLKNIKKKIKDFFLKFKIKYGKVRKFTRERIFLHLKHTQSFSWPSIRISIQQTEKSACLSNFILKVNVTSGLS